MENWFDLKNSLDAQEYIKFWQENGLEAFYIDDFPWTKYQNTLQPAILPGPYEPPEFTESQIKTLLKKNKSPFARWLSNSQDQPTEWWWIICRPPFSIDILSHKARNQTKKALTNCIVRLISPQELIKIGYNCYMASCQTHKKTSFQSRMQWEKFISSHIKYHCFDFWGIFVKNELIGYAKCVKIEKKVNLSAIWYNPNFREYYPIYALIYTLLDYYLSKQQYEYVANGMRSIAHDTQMQEFLITKFNFHKEFCRLNIVYSPFFESIIKIIYPLKSIVNIASKLLPRQIGQKINIIIKQEKIRRSFLC